LFVEQKKKKLPLAALSSLIQPLKSHQKGEIVATGNGRINDNGDTVALDVKVGDQVLFGQYAGTEIKVDGEALLVMREDDVVAVIE